MGKLAHQLCFRHQLRKPARMLAHTTRQLQMYIRIRQVCLKRGRGSSSLYEDIAKDLLPPPIKCGRSSLWIESEIDAVLAAEAAGASHGEI